MAIRTSYYTLEFRKRELKQIEEAAGPDNGVTQDDLDAAEQNARDKVNQFIVKVAGPTAGAVIAAVFLDDEQTIDPLVAQMAELIASADVLEQWERYNYAAETRDGGQPRRDPSDVRGRATKIAQDIIDAGGTLTVSGAWRRWFYAANQQGPRVSGPLVKGSWFDPKGYTDPWGRKGPGPADPYWK